MALNRKGQTSIEWLMLTAVAFLAAYIVVTRPIATFTVNMLNNIRGGIQNLVLHAEWSTESAEPGDAKHPASKERLKPKHL